MDQPKPMTEESVKEILAAAGARVMSRGGRTENYSAPREFSFEVKGAFPNGLLLHVIDIAPFDGSNPIDDAKKILAELQQYSKELADKERWLVLNKTDLLSEQDLSQQRKEITDALDWKGPVYTISALGKTGTQQVVYDIMNYLTYDYKEPERNSNVELDEITNDGQD